MNGSEAGVSSAEQERQLREDAERYHIKYEDLKAALGEEAAPDVFLVYEENCEALDVFVSCSTQWRTFSNGMLQGLDYTSLSAVMQMFGVADQKQVFADVRIMEKALIEEKQRGRK